MALLTQTLTIQQYSQHLLLSIASALQKQKIKIILCDIIQAYT